MGGYFKSLRICVCLYVQASFSVLQNSLPKSEPKFKEGGGGEPKLSSSKVVKSTALKSFSDLCP